MKIVGYTVEQQPVIGDLFFTHDTLGVSLSVSLTILQTRGYTPDLHGFYRDARAAGWSQKSVTARIREAVIDVYGFAHWQAVEQRLNQLS